MKKLISNSGSDVRRIRTLDDLREAVETLEEVERIARRVFGGAHLLTMKIEAELQKSRAALRARETPPPPSINT